MPSARPSSCSRIPTTCICTAPTSRRSSPSPTASSAPGCIRLPDPLGFAELVLKDDPNWPRAKIDAAVAAKTNRGVPLAKPLPVHLVYDTAWVDEAGTVQFRPDVYGRDQKETAVAERGGKS